MAPPTPQQLRVLKLLDRALLVQGLLLIALLVIGSATEVRSTVRFGAGWEALWLVMAILLVVTFDQRSVRYGYKRLARSSRAPWLLRSRFAMVLAMILTAAMLEGIAVYAGIPVVLHYCTRHDGMMTVTVAGKQDSTAKRQCRPRLFIAEFTRFNAYLCPTPQLYQAANVGDKVQLVGKVSPFGVEPASLVLAGAAALGTR